MQLWQEIEKINSLSVVGMQKNTGKTETFNFLLQYLKNKKNVAVTSIGVDGETVDQVTATVKPEIMIHEGMLFATAEKFFRKKTFMAEILEISERSTSVGRIVYSRALECGKVLLAGPPSTVWLKIVMSRMQKFGAELVIVDGALSRLSLASPTISEGMILATGAALSLSMSEIIKKTKHVVDLTRIEKIDDTLHALLEDKEKGVWTINQNDCSMHDWGILSVLHFDKLVEDVLPYGNILYVSGAITDRFLKNLSGQKCIGDLTVVVRDFTKVFAAPEALRSFIKAGGKLRVLEQTKIIAITVNPFAPNGYNVDGEELKKRLFEMTGLEIINVRNE